MRRLFLLLFLAIIANRLLGLSQIDSLEIRLKAVFGKERIEVLNALSSAYLDKSPEQSIKYGNSALKLSRKLHNEKAEITALKNVGLGYSHLNNYDKALEYYLKALKIEQETEYNEGIIKTLNNIGIFYNNIGNKEKALEYYLKALRIEEEKVKDDYLYLSEVCSNAGNYKMALEYYKKYTAVKDTVFNEDVCNRIAEMQVKYEAEKVKTEVLKKDKAVQSLQLTQIKHETKKKDQEIEVLKRDKAIKELELMKIKYEAEKKAKEIEILKRDQAIKELELNRQKLMKKFYIGGIVLILLLSIMTYNRYLLKKRANKQLQYAKNIIEQKNQHIMSSIKYAERIQQAILPPNEKIANAFNEYFVIFKPKDIVSGDFYWFSQIQENIFIAVVDCTGHGVPGALLSIIGNTMLNKIVNENRVFDPASIIEHLHQSVRMILKQENKNAETTDGMDVCLCKVSKDIGKIIFAGAKRPLYHFTDSKLVEIKGDRKSVGGKQKENKRTFTNKSIDVQHGDIIYLTSDGFADQNNSEGKKYGSKRLKEFLQSNANLTLAKQKEILLSELHYHQGSEEQRDDITVIGIKI